MRKTDIQKMKKEDLLKVRDRIATLESCGAELFSVKKILDQEQFADQYGNPFSMGKIRLFSRQNAAGHVPYSTPKDAKPSAPIKPLTPPPVSSSGTEYRRSQKPINTTPSHLLSLIMNDLSLSDSKKIKILKSFFE